ncbi:Rrf2 family transcriptional regulator [Candidatus Peregrinibacteria bacterium]|jgi:Rrf2 family transcriptional regulator, cysteine metabolism repressor|nr:Rrf2 family transcriptional regulator [Candidatus Peregrinibacteria bacterium]MBT4055566.1 Rrf2 family transcriptional regulator [Candidatus Peregrinibacteria bacterium]
MSSFGKLTTRERYGVRLAIQLAKTFSTKTPISLATISKEEQISTKYLEQLIVPFKKAGWVISTRGREGGYVMKKNPAQVSLRNILEVVDKKLEIVHCIGNHKKCALHKTCRAKNAWMKVQKAMETALDSVKLDQLLK